MITPTPLIFSAVRFTDLVSHSDPIPAMNRWAIFNRPLEADSLELTFRAKPQGVASAAISDIANSHTWGCVITGSTC
jgi:hypothetical protein